MVLILPFRRKGFPLFASAQQAAVAMQRGPRPPTSPKAKAPGLKPKDRRATVVPSRTGGQTRLPQSGRIWPRKGPWR